MIYHMLPKTIWQNQLSDQDYCGDTLATEGFIHCTAEPERLLIVANTWYKSSVEEWVIISIDENLVQSEVRWEENHGHIFPHIYGTLNLDAVISVFAYPRAADGTFQLPTHEIFRKSS